MDKILVGRATELDRPTREFLARKIGELAPAYTGSPVFTGVLENKRLYIVVKQR